MLRSPRTDLEAPLQLLLAQLNSCIESIPYQTPARAYGTHWSFDNTPIDLLEHEDKLNKIVEEVKKKFLSSEVDIAEATRYAGNILQLFARLNNHRLITEVVSLYTAKLIYLYEFIIKTTIAKMRSIHMSPRDLLGSIKQHLVENLSVFNAVTLKWGVEFYLEIVKYKTDSESPHLFSIFNELLEAAIKLNRCDLLPVVLENLDSVSHELIALAESQTDRTCFNFLTSYASQLDANPMSYSNR